MKTNKYLSLLLIITITGFLQLSAQNEINFERIDVVNDPASNVIFSEIKVEDIDGDGDMDIVSASQNDNKVVWYENTDGLGSFGPEQIISDVATSANSIFVVDIDGDNDMDVLFSGAFTAWFENIDGLGSYSAPQILGTTDATSIHADDIDGDGFIDIITAETNVKWYRNTDGLGTFTENVLTNEFNICASNFPICLQPFLMRDVYTGDIDNDGDIDILAGGDNTYFDGSIPGANDLDYLFWYENTDGNGTFNYHEASIYLNNIRDVRLYDADGDSALVIVNK